MSKFNQREYIKQWQKEHYKRFGCNVKIDELAKINKVLKENGMSKHDLVTLGMCVLESGLTPLMLAEKLQNDVKKRDKAITNIFEYVSLNDVTIEEARGFIIKEMSKVFIDDIGGTR